MNNEIAIIKQENIAQIVQATPKSYNDNKMSHDKCVEAGEKLLSLIEENGGVLNDELDQQIATFIEKAKKTVKRMNERRSPVTKLFDEVRSAFTAIENDIDPSKANTVSYKLQQLRNAFAKQKREEEERKRAEMMAKQQLKQAIERYKIDTEENLKQQLNSAINQSINAIKDIYNAVTLENYKQSLKRIEEISTELHDGWINNLRSTSRTPAIIPTSDAKQIEQELITQLTSKFKEQYASEIGDMKTYVLERFPSKKANLERIAKANEAEAERLKNELEQRQRLEAERLEAERIKREEEERKKTELAKQASEMNGLFSEQATISGYQPKASVTKKINILNTEGILPIVSMWWSKEGCHLSIEELTKVFKKQISFCEKIANKEGIFVQDESVEYIDDVKAK